MAHPRSPYPHLTNLLSEALGARVLGCSDDFFAAASHLVEDAPATFDPDAYYERGKVMDGWESRRKRGPGMDWAILELGAPGVIRAFDIDTAHFTGNHAPWASIEATWVEGSPDAETLRDQARWSEIVPAIALGPGCSNPAPVHDDRAWTHLRLNIHPDGGVARLRAYGEVQRELAGPVDLAALVNGGKALACSDMYFGVMDHLIAPGEAADMRGGWETRRRRGPGEDWCLVRLARRGVLHRLLLSTGHFKGNYPDTAVLEGLDWEDGSVPDLRSSPRWETILPSTKLAAHDDKHVDLDEVGPYTHVRLRIAPCGGVSRLRVFGTPSDTDPIVAHYNGLSEAVAFSAFHGTCGSERWARRMVAARPFASTGAMLSAARRFWQSASEADWREAFAHHPRIGDDPQRLRERFAATAERSASEQSSVAAASEAVLTALQEGNEAYEERFGHVFLVRAAGRSATEMLALLRDRLRNTAERELREAAAQQAQITELRLLSPGV